MAPFVYLPFNGSLTNYIGLTEYDGHCTLPITYSNNSINQKSLIVVGSVGCTSILPITNEFTAFLYCRPNSTNIGDSILFYLGDEYTGIGLGFVSGQPYGLYPFGLDPYGGWSQLALLSGSATGEIIFQPLDIELLKTIWTPLLLKLKDNVLSIYVGMLKVYETEYTNTSFIGYMLGGFKNKNIFDGLIDEFYCFNRSLNNSEHTVFLPKVFRLYNKKVVDLITQRSITSSRHLPKANTYIGRTEKDVARVKIIFDELIKNKVQQGPPNFVENMFKPTAYSSSPIFKEYSSSISISEKTDYILRTIVSGLNQKFPSYNLRYTPADKNLSSFDYNIRLFQSEICGDTIFDLSKPCVEPVKDEINYRLKTLTNEISPELEYHLKSLNTEVNLGGPNYSIIPPIKELAQNILYKLVSPSIADLVKTLGYSFYIKTSETMVNTTFRYILQDKVLGVSTELCFSTKTGCHPGKLGNKLTFGSHIHPSSYSEISQYISWTYKFYHQSGMVYINRQIKADNHKVSNILKFRSKPNSYYRAKSEYRTYDAFNRKQPEITFSAKQQTNRHAMLSTFILKPLANNKGRTVSYINRVVGNQKGYLTSYLNRVSSNFTNINIGYVNTYNLGQKGIVIGYGYNKYIHSNTVNKQYDTPNMTKNSKTVTTKYLNKVLQNMNITAKADLVRRIERQRKLSDIGNVTPRHIIVCKPYQGD